LVVVALIGTRRARIGAAIAALAGLVFSLDALSAPPTNGATTIANVSGGVVDYLHLSPGAGVGETVAIVALLVALAGLALSFSAD
jgi:hypothetical protein